MVSLTTISFKSISFWFSSSLTQNWTVDILLMGLFDVPQSLLPKFENWFKGLIFLLYLMKLIDLEFEFGFWFWLGFCLLFDFDHIILLVSYLIAVRIVAIYADAVDHVNIWLVIAFTSGIMRQLGCNIRVFVWVVYNSLGSVFIIVAVFYWVC